MTTFAYYLLKVILCSGVLFLYYHLALRNKLFHQWNRFYLLFTVALSMLLPLIRINLLLNATTQGDLLALLRSAQHADEYLEEFVVVGQHGWSAGEWALFAYGICCLLLLGAFLFSLQKIAGIVRSHPSQKVKDVVFVETEVSGTPFSFFNYVIWNRHISLDSATGQQIFQHELVHVRQKHTLDKIFLQLLLVFFWCNPFFWLIRREIRSIHEFLADKASLNDQSVEALAAVILQAAFPKHFASITNAFFQTSIKRRIMMLTKKQGFDYASRIVALPVAAALSLAFTVRTNGPAPENWVKPDAATSSLLRDTVPTENIASVSVNSKDEKKTITIRFKDGKTKTYTKEQAVKEGLLNKDGGKQANNGAPNMAAPPPLYLVNGEEFTGDINTIDPNDIASINVLKNSTATDKYGEKGKNGVVEITLKEGKTMAQAKSNNIVFEVAETPASIDQQEWRQFLEQNTAPLIQEISKKAPNGKYTVNVRFIVDKDGSLSDFKAMNDPGYSIAEKVLDLMKKAPKWNPAVQNGHVVRSYHTQPITFVISGEKTTS